MADSGLNQDLQKLVYEADALFPGNVFFTYVFFTYTQV